jgi:hypothetical protein
VDGYGTVFELVKNGGGSYTPTTLLSFNGESGRRQLELANRGDRRL